MKLRRFTAILTAGALTLTLAACGSSGSSSSSSSSSAETAAAAATEAAAEAAEPVAESGGEETYFVGICQLVQHVALDLATEGFKDALTDAFGDNVTFDEQNAGGDAATAATITTNLVAEGVDLIMANATAALQAAAAATGDIPILGTSITDYGVALDLDDYDGVVGGNISGTSDCAPLDEQAAMIMELFPDVENVGIIYCSAEPNSKYQSDVVEAALKEAGVNVSIFTFSDSNDVSAVTQEACASSDVLYIPTDNTAASCVETINNVALPAGTPIVAGEEGIMAGCGVATLSISYYNIGYVTGEMAASILTGEADISTMPIAYDNAPVKEYNPAMCEALGVEIPDDYLAYEG